MLGGSLLGWIWYGFAIGRIAGALDWDPQQWQRIPFRAILLPLSLILPILAAVGLAIFPLLGTFGTPASQLWLGIGMGISWILYIYLTHSHQRCLGQLTLLWPRGGNFLYRLERPGLSQQRRRRRIADWASWKRLRQHPATARTILEDSGPEGWKTLVREGPDRYRSQALRRLCQKAPEETEHFLNNLPPRVLARCGKEMILELLHTGTRRMRQEAYRAAGKLEFCVR